MKGFDRDEGASLVFAFKGLQGGSAFIFDRRRTLTLLVDQLAQSVAEGRTHFNAAQALDKQVAKPFANWSKQHEDRVLESKRVSLDGWVASWESQKAEVAKVRSHVPFILDFREGMLTE